MNVTSNSKSFEDKAQEIRQRAADSLESAADSVRTAGNDSAEAIGSLAHNAGARLDSAAGRVRTARVGDRMLCGLRSKVRRRPMRSLAVAAAIGLVAGFTCRASH